MNHRILREIGDLLAELRSRPARTFVALGALTLGVAAISGVFAVHAGLESRAETAIRGLGEGVAAIANAEPHSSATVNVLTRKHVAILRASFPEVGFTTTRRYPAPARGSAGGVVVIETDAYHDEVRHWRLADGRFLDHRDLETRARVAVPTRALADRGGWRVGEWVMIGSLPFEVVGIVDSGLAFAEPGGPNPYAVVESAVFVPTTTAPRWHIDSAYADDRIDAVFVSLPPDIEERTLAAIIGALSDPALGVGPVAVTTAETLTRGIRELQFVVAVAGGGVGALVLLLGGAMLAALTIAEVRGRTAEIGLRRAIGAGADDIARLFVLETGAIAATAGIIATVVAMPILASLARQTDLPFAVDAWTLVAPVIMALGVGMAAAAWPATRAAALEPSLAMRDHA